MFVASESCFGARLPRRDERSSFGVAVSCTNGPYDGPSAPGEEPDDRYPLVLVTGRRWAHYNSGSMTRRSGNLLLDPTDRLDLHPDDAARHGVRDGDPVTVESRHGRARLTVRVTLETAPGQAFCAFHFPASGVNRLTSDRGDTVTSCPEYKVTAVRLRPQLAGAAGEAGTSSESRAAGAGT